MECKYCTSEDGWRYIVDKTYQFLKTSSGLNICIDKDELFITEDVCGIIAMSEKIKINFCPMCGRKLVKS